jgi:hypothetical protein
MFVTKELYSTLFLSIIHYAMKADVCILELV